MRFKTLSLLFGLSALPLLANQIEKDDQDNYNSADFAKLSGETMGRAKMDHVFEIAYTPGIVNDLLIGSIAYAHIVGNGKGEVIIPFVGTQFNGNELTNANGQIDSIAMIAPKYKGIGTGLKYRNFVNRIEEGPFYGGGLRIYHWIWDYQKQVSGKIVSRNRSFQSFIPHFELGYISKLDKSISFVSSIEGGVALHTLDPLELGLEKNGTPFNQRDSLGKLDPIKFAYYSANIGLRFAF